MSPRPGAGAWGRWLRGGTSRCPKRGGPGGAGGRALPAERSGAGIARHFQLAKKDVDH